MSLCNITGGGVRYRALVLDWRGIWIGEEPVQILKVLSWEGLVSRNLAASLIGGLDIPKECC